MNKEAQRIAIAEACGYSIGEKATNGVVTVLKQGQFKTCFSGKRITNPTLKDAIEKKCVPDYLNDLNAMHEAEKVLTERQREVYADVLYSESKYRVPDDDDYIGYIEMPARNAFDFAHATAAQRAQAFLRTLGLWKDEIGQPTERNR